MPIGDGDVLGIYDANSVRDRVRQWQSQGGGVAGADDIDPECDDDYSMRKKERRTSTRRSDRVPSCKELDISLTPPRTGRNLVKAEDAASTRTRSRSTPAKRVVSDQHWRKKRSPAKNTGFSKVVELAPTTPPVPPSNGDIGSQSATRLEAGEKRRCASARTTPNKDLLNDSNKRFRESSQSEPRKWADRPGRRQRQHSQQIAARSVESPNSATSPKEDAEGNMTHAVAGSATQNLARASKAGSPKWRRSSRNNDKRDETPERRMNTDENARERSLKGSIKKAFQSQPSEVINTPRVPSIEQWLHGTPDPFVDSEGGNSFDVTPSRSPSHKRTVNQQVTTVGNSSHTRSALSTNEDPRRIQSGDRRRKRIPSSAIYEDNPFPSDFDAESGLSSPTKGAKTERASKFVDLVKELPQQSQPTLTRGGADKNAPSSISDRKKSREDRKIRMDGGFIPATNSESGFSSIEDFNATTPLQPPGLGHRRPFPFTGSHQLSTIASVETFNTKDRAMDSSLPSSSPPIEQMPALHEHEVAANPSDRCNLNPLVRKGSRLTKHADLISVLSLPRGPSRSIQSARSIRTNRSRLATATPSDLMQELATDEVKYMRELRTLVDGVIPVLLSCVLSRSDSAVAAGLFRPSTKINSDPNFTKPIVDMGIALERLKTLHKRLPTEPNAFLTWAHGAQRVYTEYLKSWRMGFQDVVVNLAPALIDENDKGLEEGLPRNAEGDVLNGDGERVDVAFLLKRPLVRLKYLAKTLRGLHHVQQSSEADLLATKYQRLVDDARQRSNEERARLEDETAANIDASRARDLRTLAPLIGVIVDKTRRVRARDHFNLALQHSSGQCVDCRVELLFRDEASGEGPGGDVLICEVDGTGRWLLFPPMNLDAVSARNGDLQGEIIIMIRGKSSNGSQWQEIITLISDEENAGFEWVQMLGLTPVPPRVSRSQSFVSRHQRKKSEPDVIVPSQRGLPCGSDSPGKSRTPSPREIEVPIGEVAQGTLKARTDSTSPDDVHASSSPLSGEVAAARPGLQQQLPSPLSTPTKTSTNYVDQVNDLRSLPSQHHVCDSRPHGPARTPRSFKEALGLSGSSNSMGLKRASAKRISRHQETSPRHKRSPFSSPSNSDMGKPDSEPSPDRGSLSGDKVDEQTCPPGQRSLSATPSLDLPHISRARDTTPSISPTTDTEEVSLWSAPPQRHLQASSNKLSKKRPRQLKSEPPPVAATPTLDLASTPVLDKGWLKQRRSSSPLKHQYDPSTASDTASGSGASTVERNEVTSISDESSDEEVEDGDIPTPLMPTVVMKGLFKLSAKPSLNSSANGSIKPSESASQAPYKMVPAQPAKACKTIASIFTWLDAGKWEQLHPDECSIVITPGLIEAYEMSAAHSHAVPPSSSTPVVDAERFSDLASTTTSQNDDVQGDRPLVALELTPLVPLRRGTALDISIRSPPTPQSQITSGSNIMFRSRNPEECEALYALINHSRIHNPTFIALQNARPSFTPGGSMGRPGSRRTSSHAGSQRGSWFGVWGHSSSYRASSRRTPSLAPSESSIGSMSSAFSALKRFSARNNGMFNIAQSTIGSRTGSRPGSVYTSSDQSSGSGTNSLVPPGMMADARKDAPIGLTDAKIRLYIRETASKWRDMGAGRLTIKRAESKIQGPDGRPMSSGGADRQLMHEKRIIVNGKTKGEVLLDVQLGESCFERVARTGIAVSVWEDIVGPNGEVGVVNAVGGVSGGRAKVYMLQVSLLPSKN